MTKILNIEQRIRLQYFEYIQILKTEFLPSFIHSTINHSVNDGRKEGRKERKERSTHCHWEGVGREEDDDIIPVFLRELGQFLLNRLHE